MPDQPSQPSQPSQPGQPDQPFTPQYGGQPSSPGQPGQPGQPDVVEWGQGTPIGESSAPERSGSRKKLGIGIGAGVVAVGLLAGGGALAASRLGGGGAQPDEVVPATALGYVGVDLDPSAGQKLDALRFFRKFPDAAKRVQGDGDLRKALFDVANSDGDLGTWATDVEPWLGQRAGVAVLPPTKEGGDPRTVVVLAVTDADKAKAGIAKVSKGEAVCEFPDGFAVCGEKTDAHALQLDVAAAEDASLADDATYQSDVEAAGGSGVLHTWFDLAKVREAVPDSLGQLGGVQASTVGDALKGRVAATVRFDGAAVELSGRLVGGPKVPTGTARAAVGDLPADTVAALAVGVAPGAVQQAWDNARATLKASGAEAQFGAQLQRLQQATGLQQVADLAAALGDRVTVADGAGQPTPQVAVRLGGDAAAVGKVRSVVEQAAGGTSSGLQLASAPAGDDTVLSNDQAYAAKVAAGSGLGASAAFRAAAPHASDASAVLYVDVAKALEQAGSLVGGDASVQRNLKPLQSLGVTSTTSGDTVSFTARVTTR
ncbi:DUF3352 domain-containing protein [Angustibacter aerolatus]